MEDNRFDFETFKQSAIKGMYEGKPLNGEKGIFAPLLKHFLETALEAELQTHLEKEEQKGNRKNGKRTKTVKSLSGEFPLTTSRDRESTFEPVILPKRQVILTDELEEKVIALYGKGLSLRDISAHIKEMYQMEISASELSSITDKIIPAVKEWQNRPLQAVYCFVWMDCMHYKVRHEGRVISRAVYNILALDTAGKKELIGMYVSESEGAKFWLSVLTDLKNRGLEDMLIVCIDGLQGFPQAIEAIFPLAKIQTCVVHQIRNSLRYIAEKDKKTFVTDLKLVYQATNREAGYEKLLEMEEKWGKKYPVPLQSWFTNWENLATFYDYDQPIRKVIYTTNIIEGFHRQVRKVSKTKGAFVSDMALLKLIYLTLQNISVKWTMPVRNWNETLSQLYIIFGDRLRLHLTS